ncbi:MAG: AMP-binding protein [Puniceicoccaceae bacterium]
MRHYETVHRIWSEIFPNEDLRSESDFFDLGGDSMAAVAMQAAVEKETSIHVPLGHVLRNSSLGAFARSLDELKFEPGRAIVTPMVAAGTQPPIFAITPAAGGAFHYQELVREIKAGQPVYAVEPRVGHEGISSYSSFEDLARSCLREIRTIQPLPPYHLVGYSFGGALAFQIAKELEAAEETVAFLGAIDSVCRGRDQYLGAAGGNLLRRSGYHLPRLFGYLALGIYHRKCPNLWNLLELALAKFKKLEGEVPPEPFGEPAAQVELRRHWDPGTYGGRLWFLRATTQVQISRVIDCTSGWGFRAKGGLKIAKVRGEHTSLMRHPSVHGVASWLNRELLTVQNPGSMKGELHPDLDSPYSYEDLCPTLERFHWLAVRLGDHPAICDESGVISWKSLRESVQRQAGLLRQRIQPQERVGIFLENSIQFVATSLAVLSARGVVVPLEVELPSERLIHILESADINLVLTQSEKIDSLKEKTAPFTFAILDIADLDEVTGEVVLDSTTPGPQDPALLFFTSGSTGKPKGVLHNHIGLAHIGWRRGAGIGLRAGDRYLSTYPAAFMGAANGIYGCLQYGATLYLYNVKRRGFIGVIPYANHNGINVLHSVTSVYRQITEFVQPSSGLPSLRAVVPGGEAIKPGDIAKFDEKFPSHCTLFASLGATEYGSLAFEPLPREREIPGHIPVGRPLPGVRAYILNHEREVVPHGVPGEIAVHCDTATCEYWKDPERTTRLKVRLADGDEVFLTGDQGFFDPEGRLVNLGRLDNLVKVNGYRTEIGDVESAFLSLESVSGVAIVAMDTPNGVELVAYWTRANAYRHSKDSIRNPLADKLPPSMVPKHIIELPELPTLVNGKLDRSRIEEMARSRNHDSGPRP